MATASSIQCYITQIFYSRTIWVISAIEIPKYLASALIFPRIFFVSGSQLPQTLNALHVKLNETTSEMKMKSTSQCSQ